MAQSRNAATPQHHDTTALTVVLQPGQGADDDPIPVLDLAEPVIRALDCPPSSPWRISVPAARQSQQGGDLPAESPHHEPPAVPGVAGPDISVGLRVLHRPPLPLPDLNQVLPPPIGPGPAAGPVRIPAHPGSGPCLCPGRASATATATARPAAERVARPLHREGQRSDPPQGGGPHGVGKRQGGCLLGSRVRRSSGHRGSCHCRRRRCRRRCRRRGRRRPEGGEGEGRGRSEQRGGTLPPRRCHGKHRRRRHGVGGARRTHLSLQKKIDGKSTCSVAGWPGWLA